MEYIRECVDLIQYIRHGKGLDSFFDVKISSKKRQLWYAYARVKCAFPEFAGLAVIEAVLDTCP